MTIASHRDNVSLGSAGIAGSGSGFSTTRGISVTINGKANFVPAGSGTISVGAKALTANQKCAFFVLAAPDGTLSTQQSTVAGPSADLSVSYQPGAYDWPDVPDRAVIGAVVVDAGNAAFTPGTTALGSATFVDVAFDYGVPLTY